jgi:hypothetical protein
MARAPAGNQGPGTMDRAEPNDHALVSCHGHVPSRGRPYGLSTLTDTSSSDAGPVPGLGTTFDLPPLPLGSLHRDPRATVPTLSSDSLHPSHVPVHH